MAMKILTPGIQEPDLALRTRTAFEAARLGVRIAMNARETISLPKDPDDGRIKRTEASIETAIGESIRQIFPGEILIGEEIDDIKPTSARREWIVDPIDGTDAFSSCDSLWTVSVAMFASGLPVLGVVIAPELRLLYQTTSNLLAYRNAEEISLSSGSLGHAGKRVVGFGWYGRDNKSLRAELARELSSQGFACEWDIPASIGLAWVAEGRLGGYFDDQVHLWDVAGGAAIALLAGARVSIDSWLLTTRNGGRILASERQSFELLSQHFGCRSDIWGST